MRKFDKIDIISIVMYVIEVTFFLVRVIIQKADKPWEIPLCLGIFMITVVSLILGNSYERKFQVLGCIGLGLACLIMIVDIIVVAAIW